jgi:hypothetical protein
MQREEKAAGLKESDLKNNSQGIRKIGLGQRITDQTREPKKKVAF